MKRKVLFLVSVAIIVLVTSVASAAEYIYHCDFSEWNELPEGQKPSHQSPRGMPVGWTYYNPTNLGDVLVEPMEDALTGELAVRVVDNDPGKAVGIVSEYVPEIAIPAVSDTRYIVSTRLKVVSYEPGSCIIRVRVWFRVGTSNVGDKVVTLPAAPSSDYETIEILTNLAPAGTTGIVIYIWSEGASVTEFLIDDVTVQLEPKYLSLVL